MPDTPTLGPDGPQQVGKYEVITRIASGGMGELLLGRERGIGGFERLVAIKRILPHLAEDETFRDMFLREARILARLNHPNVVQTIELGEDRPGHYFLVMEYIRGTTLRELQVLTFALARRFDINVAVGAVIQGLRGLHATHELRGLDDEPLGLVHRDISPHNLMATADGSVKLFDFGVAKGTVSDELTNSGGLKGKFPYMAPEQVHRRPIDRRADIFSMGTVLWELLAGRPLFKRDSELATLTAITDGDVPNLLAERPQVPASVARAVERALTVSITERWQTASDFEQALLDACNEAGLDTSPAVIADFVGEVAGERLEERNESLVAALDGAISEAKREAIVHDDDELAPTAVDLPRIPVDSREETALQARGEPEPPQFRDVEKTERRPPPVGWALGAAALGAVAAVAVALTIGATPAGEPITLAWAPTSDPEVIREEFEPIRSYLEEELDRPVRFSVGATYEETAELLVSGDVDFAGLPPWLYVRTSREAEGVTPLVSKIFDGSKTTDGLIVVSADSTARKLEDLRGEKFCFTDRRSTTGYMLPTAYLNQQGFSADEFVGGIEWSGDHAAVLRDLLDGKCAAAATHSGAIITASEVGIPAAQIRRLAITGVIPNGTVTAGPHVDEETRNAVAEALLRFDPQEHAGESFVGATQRITGFTRQDDDGYRLLREAIE